MAENPDAEMGPEDQKLVVLAKGARARIHAPEGAAVRDTDGRSYAAPTVSAPGVAFSALELAVANALAAGAIGLEGAVVVAAESEVDAAPLGAFAGSIPLHIVAP